MDAGVGGGGVGGGAWEGPDVRMPQTSEEGADRGEEWGCGGEEEGAAGQERCGLEVFSQHAKWRLETNADFGVAPTLSGDTPLSPDSIAPPSRDSVAACPSPSGGGGGAGGGRGAETALGGEIGRGKGGRGGEIYSPREAREQKGSGREEEGRKLTSRGGARDEEEEEREEEAEDDDDDDAPRIDYARKKAMEEEARRISEHMRKAKQDFEVHLLAPPRELVL